MTDGDLRSPLLSMYCTAVKHSQSLSLVKPSVGPRVSSSPHVDALCVTRKVTVTYADIPVSVKVNNLFCLDQRQASLLQVWSL